MNWKAVCSLFKYSITIHQPTKSKIILLIYHRLLGLSMKALMVLVGTFICLEYLASVSIFLSVLILATLPSALLLMDSFSHCWQLPHLSSISSGTEHQYPSSNYCSCILLIYCWSTVLVSVVFWVTETHLRESGCWVSSRTSTQLTRASTFFAARRYPEIALLENL